MLPVRRASATGFSFISSSSGEEDDMKQAYFSKAAVTLSVMVILALAAVPWSSQSASPQLTVTIVSDDAPGLAARHGLNTLADALKARGVAVAQANSLEAAHGETLIVAGRGAASVAAAAPGESFLGWPPGGGGARRVRPAARGGGRGGGGGGGGGAGVVWGRGARGR